MLRPIALIVVTVLLAAPAFAKSSAHPGAPIVAAGASATCGDPAPSLPCKSPCRYCIAWAVEEPVSDGSVAVNELMPFSTPRFADAWRRPALAPPERSSR